MTRAVSVLCCVALLAGCGDDPAGTSESQDLVGRRALVVADALAALRDSSATSRAERP
jgi:hypothetical protein